MKRIIVVAVLACFTFLANADTKLPGQCLVGRPKLINQDLIKEKDLDAFLKKGKNGDWAQGNKVARYWEVYSDRENNTTYNGPSTTSGRFATLDFNEAVRIAKIENGFALVYKERKTSAVYPAINDGLSRGWIPMDNLLLWGSCPTNDIGIYYKALPVINIDEYQRSGKGGELGRCYQNPATKTGSTELRTGMDFYFVMKRDKEHNLVLLASECKMSGHTYKVLYGWVSPSSYVAWNQRACLEPNWIEEAAEKFQGKEVNVFRTSQMSNKACSMPLGRANDYGQSVTKYRMYADEMRYPVLDNTSGNDNVYKVTAFATPDGTGHVAKVRTGQSAQQIAEDHLKKMSIINLIVVIDGTSSMKNYYAPTQKIIQQANDYFSKQQGNIVRVGVVIYRDFPDGQYVTEYLPMCSPSDPALAEFLNTGGKYGVRSVAESATEALYKGIEVGLDTKTMGYSKENSNLMFIIGDCGNDLEDNSINEQKLIEKIAASRVQISAFQVYNGTSQAYKLFSAQTGEIVRNSLNKLYGTDNTKLARWREVPNGYEYSVNKSEGISKFYIGNVRYPQNGEQMQVSTLYDIVRDSYLQFNEAIEIQKGITLHVEDFVGMLADDKMSDRSASAKIDKTFFESIFSAKELAILTQGNMLMAFEGYTSKKDDVSGYDYWQPVIYISQDEFNALMEKLQPVMAAANEGSEDRRPYIEAMKALVRTILPDITEAEMNNKSTKEIMSLVAGLNVTSNALQGRTLVQLQDTQTVNQAEFDALISNFRTKYNKLDKIKTEAYKYSIERNRTRWYWIPVADLP